MHTHSRPWIGVVATLMMAGCSSVHVIDASAAGGTIVVRGPAPATAVQDYLHKSCPHGFRIVDEERAAPGPESEPVVLVNSANGDPLVTIEPGADPATRVQYVCDSAPRAPRAAAARRP